MTTPTGLELLDQLDDLPLTKDARSAIKPEFNEKVRTVCKNGHVVDVMLETWHGTDPAAQHVRLVRLEGRTSLADRFTLAYEVVIQQRIPKAGPCMTRRGTVGQ